MKMRVIGVVFASTLLLAGCASKDGGVLEITENGTYDVNDYSQVKVTVGESSEDQGKKDEEAKAAAKKKETAEAKKKQNELELECVQLKCFSIELPKDMVKDYTEAELMENSTYAFTMGGGVDGENAEGCELLINSTDHIPESMTLDRIARGVPQEDVGGITMAVKHNHIGDRRNIEVEFIFDGVQHRLSFLYPVAQDEMYADYADSFYKTIAMTKG